MTIVPTGALQTVPLEKIYCFQPLWMAVRPKNSLEIPIHIAESVSSTQMPELSAVSWPALSRERERLYSSLSPLSSPRSNPRTLLPISRSVAVSGFGRTYDSLRKTEKKNKCVAVAAVVVVGRSLKKNGSVAVVRRWRREGRRRQEEGISWKTRDLLRDSLFLLFFLFCARALSRFYCSVSQFPEENPSKKKKRCFGRYARKLLQFCFRK